MALGKTVILYIFDTSMGILDKKSLPLYLYWIIYMGKLNDCSALQYNKQEEGPRMTLGYIDCLLQRTNWYISHSCVSCGKVWLRWCRGVKRYRVPPSPSELASVYTSGWGIVISQDINFFYPLPRKVCVSIYKTSIRVFAHPWLNCEISRRYTRCQVDITVQPSESGLITVYLYIPETGPQNGVGWLLQKVIYTPTCCVTWMYCPYTWVISSKIWWPFEHSTERCRDLTISEPFSL